MKLKTFIVVLLVAIMTFILCYCVILDKKENNTYSILGELEGFNKEGAILKDIDGHLWEAPGLFITKSNILILEIKDNQLERVLVVTWVREEAN